MAGGVIRLYEHQFMRYDALGLPPGAPALDVLERLNQSARREIIRLERTGLRALGLVGVIQLGAWTVEILPWLDAAAGSEGADPTDQSAARNLLALLSYVTDLPLHAEEAAGLAHDRPQTWLDLLTRLFALYLYQPLHSGPAHSYVPREETLPVLRGRWNLARQARRLPQPRPEFEVSYAEFSADTPLNQVLRFVVERLLSLTQDVPSRGQLARLREMLRQVSLLPALRPGLLEEVRFDRLTAPFRPAFQLAQLFLSGNAVQLRTGPQPAWAFVFDMAALFERFTAAFLQRYKERILPEAWRGSRLSVQSAGLRAYLAECEGRPALRLKPDLLLLPTGGARPLLAADSKYKLLAADGLRHGLEREDAYQMLAYMARLDCARGLLLYPQPPNGRPVRKRLRLHQPPGGTILACTINLHAPVEPPTGLIAELAHIFRLAAQAEN